MGLKIILTAAQRERLLSVEHLSEEDFQAYFSFSDSDLEIINQHRGNINKLGFAIQLCLARYPGCSLSNWSVKPDRLTSYVIRQLHLGPIDLSSYNHRNTRSNHFNEILETFRYQRFGSNGNREQLIEYLVNLSLENDDSTFLMKETLDFLTCNRIIFPSIATLEDVISHCRAKAESTLFSILLQPLTEIQIEKLDDLLRIFKETKMTKLAWLKDIPGKANPESFMSICKKIEAINAIELGTINVEHIHRNRFLQLARLGDNYDAYDFSRFEFEKKYALLIAFLVDHHQYLIDQLIEINDRILGSIKRKGTDDQLRRKITHGLNKTEAVNALARELFFGRRGKFMERYIRRQLQSASALNVLINAISIWNAVYLQEAHNYLVKIDPQVTRYMRHISPINWEHITFLGEYKFDLLSIPKHLRKLNIEK